MFFNVNRFLQKPSFGVVVILLVGIIVYANTFNVPFFLDDYPEIIDNADIYHLNEFLFSAENLLTNRYVAHLISAVNYHFGGLDVTGYHIANLIIHLGSALLVYLLLHMTLRTPFFNLSGKPVLDKDHDMFDQRQERFRAGLMITWIPLLAALLFVAHPVQTQAVTYIVQRMTSLATFFYLLSLALYVKGRLLSETPGVKNRGQEGVSDQPQRKALLMPGLLIAGSVVSAILAMKSKEIAFTLPLAIVLYEIYFFRGPLVRRMLFLLPVLATLPIIPLHFLDYSASIDESMSSSLDQLRVETTLSRQEYLFTQFRVIVTYLRLLVLPVKQNFDYDYPIFSSFFDLQVSLSFLLIMAILMLAFYLFRKSAHSRMKLPGEQCDKSHKQQAPRTFDELASGADEFQVGVTQQLCPPAFLRLISYGIFWFFLTLAVESSLIPIRDVIVEHRLYLPSFGAAMVFSTVICLLIGRFSGRAAGQIFIAVTVLLTMVLGFATWQRNTVWGSSLSLWQDVINKSPNKARPYNNLSVALENSGNRQQAIKTLIKAIEIDPEFFISYYNLAELYLVNDQPQAALPLLKRAIDLKPDFTKAYVMVCAVFMRSAEYQKLVSYFQEHLNVVGKSAEARYYLGAAYAFMGDKAAARQQLQVLQKLDPTWAKYLRPLIR